jgi:hypothetical protein
LPRRNLPPEKTLDSFDFDAVPMVSKAQVMAIAAATAGSRKVPISSCSVRRAAERAISPRPSTSR